MKTLFALFIISSITLLSQAQITTDECKRDCTLDWVDCVHKCQSIGNPQSCHQSCEKIVKSCVGECPKIICLDSCRVHYEKCRKNEETECDEDQTKCQNTCDNIGMVKKEEV